MLVLSGPFLGGTEIQVCKEAAQLYDQGSYKDAYTRYESSEQKTSDIWYNMGNCAYKSGDTPRALICWDRAIELAPSSDNSDCYKNIRFASNSSGIAYDMSHSWLDDFLRFFSFSIWQLMLLLVWYGAVWSFLSQKKRWYTCGLVSLSLLVGYVVHGAYTLESQKGARIKHETCLLSGPNKDFHQVANLPPMARVSIVDTKDSWYKVYHKNIMGWIAMDALEVL